MKIYISGKVSGLPYADVQQKFQEAQDLLEYLGFEVVNPLKNGLNHTHTWRQHIVRDIELLLPCDAIYMLANWVNSVGAGIEYDVAIRTSKDIWFETNIVRNQINILKIQNAIHEVTEMKFNEYTTKSRKRDGFFARMLFAYHCHRYKMKLTNIAKYIHRAPASMSYLLKKYDDEVKYNPNFRELAQRVYNILNKTSNADTNA